MGTVVIAGATGYLGHHLVNEYRHRGWTVHAIVRDVDKAQQQGLAADRLIEAEATDPATLAGVFDDVELVVSSLGITRQRDGLSYRDVDYQANLNLLEAALAANVTRFAYIHVLGAKLMRDVPLVAAKQDFVDKLQAAPIKSTIIAPSGYFSDMGDFLAMAQSGRVWLFGDGTRRLNPIHGADLAKATADAIEEGLDWLDVGGPDVFTHNELAELAFSVLGKPPRITHLPDLLRRLALAILPWTTPRYVSGPARFFLTALGNYMVGECRGTHHLAEHFAEIVENDRKANHVA